MDLITYLNFPWQLKINGVWIWTDCLFQHKILLFWNILIQFDDELGVISLYCQKTDYIISMYIEKWM